MKVDVSRSQDPELLETILRRDYFDPPIRHFPASMVSTVVHDWIPSSPFVYVYIATIEGRYAGFIFAHTRGPALWREFARRYMTRHALGLALTWWRMRVRPRGGQRPSPPTDGAHIDGGSAPPSLTESGRPFQWTPPTGHVGYVDVVFVPAHARGRDCARHLLTAATNGMVEDGVELVEAHIDATNYASMRAFQKAGWELFRTRDRDVYARFRAGRLAAPPPSTPDTAGSNAA